MLKLSEERIKKLSKEKLIVSWKGNVLDLTEYKHIHPGGKEILEDHNGKDIDKEFEEIGHSLKAYKILEKQIIGKKENYYEYSESKSILKQNRIIRKLFTREDYANIHKILGLFSLLHIICMTVVLSLPEKYCNIYKGQSKVLRSVPSLIHSFLSISSLQFNVPNISDGNIPAIHTMFRAHSICFALRGVACNLAIIWLEDKPVIMKCIQVIIVNLTLIIADWITKEFTHKSDNYRTTASMPYWSECSQKRQRYQKMFYSWTQFGATALCLDEREFMPLSTLLGIQGAALFMTLCRKQLISPYTYHNLYTATLIYPLIVWSNSIKLLPKKKERVYPIVFASISYILRCNNISKYYIWGIICFYKIIIEIKEENDSFKNIYFVLASIFTMLAIIWSGDKLSISDGNKNDPNNRIIEKKKIHDNEYILKIKTRTKLYVYAGQHIIISKNGQEHRRYTPIKIDNTGNQSVITLAIKRYPNKISEYITNLKKNDTLCLSGPVGSKYINNNIFYTPEEKIPLDNSKHFLMFSAGSGVTPIYSIAKIMEEVGQSYQIIHSDKNKECVFISDYLNSLNKVFYHYTSVSGRLSDNDVRNYIKKCNKETIVLSCGPDKFNVMISKNSKLSIIF